MSWQEWVGFVVLYVLGGCLVVAGVLIAAAVMAEALARFVEDRRIRRIKRNT